MIDYRSFKSELAKRCERGSLPKTIKKQLSSYDDACPSMLVYRVCSDLLLLFSQTPHGSGWFPAVCELAAELVCGAELPNALRHDGAVLGAYITLCGQANSSRSPEGIIKKLAEHSEEFNRSLQNIKYGMPIFSAKVEK